MMTRCPGSLYRLPDNICFLQIGYVKYDGEHFSSVLADSAATYCHYIGSGIGNVKPVWAESRNVAEKVLVVFGCQALIDHSL